MCNGVYFLALSLSFIMYFLFYRLFIDLAVRYMINRSNYKKRRKGQNFVDWLLFRRYRDVIPKRYYVLYWTIPALYIICMTLTVVFGFLSINSNQICSRVILAVYFIWCLILLFIPVLKTTDKNGNTDFSRILNKKRRGNKIVHTKDSSVSGNQVHKNDKE